MSASQFDHERLDLAVETAGDLHRALDEIVARRVFFALADAATAIERRRLSRRERWLRHHRWSGQDEKRWSQGMWDAGSIVNRLAKDTP